MTIVVLGDVMVDVLARINTPLAYASDTPADIGFSGGGSAANTAAWLGSAARLICRVGDDDAGRAQVAELRAYGVDVRAAIDPVLATGTCIVIVDQCGERTMLPDRGANNALSAADVDLDGARHLHISGYALLASGAVAALAEARSRGIPTSVDPASAATLPALHSVDLLLPNLDEAMDLTGETDPVVAARALAAATGAEVVVTCGAAGAVHSSGVSAPATAAELVDSTGAGDAFAAGLLAARVSGATALDQLAAGNALAAAAIAVQGARPMR